MWIESVQSQTSFLATYGRKNSGTYSPATGGAGGSTKPSPAAALRDILSSGYDRLFSFHRWRAHRRVLGIEEIKPIPYTPLFQSLH